MMAMANLVQSRCTCRKSHPKLQGETGGILVTAKHPIPLSDIYNFNRYKVPILRHNKNCKKYIRYNLSINDCFIRIVRPMK
ncbi:hypothetical protein FKM82_008773 [Ascaphus truei]